MYKINFSKTVASGNDFVIIEPNYRLPITDYRLLAKKICDRKLGVGADGLLVLEKSKVADVKMRVFNADGSEAEMCGNGARCVAMYNSKFKIKNSKVSSQNSKLNIETKAGIIEAQVKADNVKIKLSEPKGIKLNILIRVSNRTLRVNFINTGVAHTVIFVEGLDKIDVVNLGRQIRSHQKFAPRGTNVDFVEALNRDFIKVRTYERGVEDETLACGTGAVAAAIMAKSKWQKANGKKINVYTKSGEILKVYFKYINKNFSDVWLEGKARIVYRGEYYV